MKPGTFLARAPAALPFLLLFYALVWNAGLPAGAAIALTVFFVASAWRPGAAVRILTALVPFTIAWAWRWSDRLQWGEALTITFLAGAILHVAAHPSDRRVRWRAADLLAVGFGVLVGASWVVDVAILQHISDFPLPFLGTVWHLFTRDFFGDPGAFVRLNEGILLVEGVALFVCVRRLSSVDPALPGGLLRLTVVGAAASASLNAVRIVELLLARGFATLSTVAPALRFSVSHRDVNAAGSYFAMVLPIALALLAGNRKGAGWAASAALIGAALWLAGSRVAMAAAALAVVGLLAACVLALRMNRPARAAAVVALVVCLSLIGSAAIRYPARRNIDASTAFSVRADMATVAMRLFETRPVFGVGVGTFWARSAEFMPSRLKEFYSRENAHNNFLQILAELGAVGLTLFVALLALALRPWSRVREGEAILVAGALAGLSAFLLTCLGGHPLLTREVAYPFWICLGALSVLRDPPAGTAALDRVAGRRPRVWLTAGIAALTLTVPFRITRELREGDFDNVAIGYSVWSTSEDGMRFRWAEPRSRFFVAGTAGSVLIPLRLGGDAAGGLLVDVRLDGRLANRVQVTRDRWTMVRVVVPPAQPPTRYRTIELDVVAAADSANEGGTAGRAGLMVGRPTTQEQQ